MNRLTTTLITCFALLLPASAAGAQEIAQAVSTNTVSTAAVEGQMTQLQSNYSSVTAAMAAYYAVNKGQALSAYLVDNPSQINRLGGSVSSGNLRSIMSSASSVRTPQELEALLVANGVGLDVNSWNTIGGAARDLEGKSASLDAAVLNAGMTWAASLSMLTVPKVNAPGIPAMDTTLATSMPNEGLAFGMFMSRSLANLIGNFPDVFSQVRATGVASPSANDAWRKAMNSAAGASFTTMKSLVGSDPCGQAFIGGLTGLLPGGCSPCAVAGMYGNAQLQLMIDPANSPKGLKAGNPLVSTSQMAEQSGEERSTTLKQSPALAPNLDQTLSEASGCVTAAGAVQASADLSMPKIVNYLARN